MREEQVTNDSVQSLGAIDLIDHAFYLVRREYAALALHYLGTVPFVLGVLYFWSEMRSYAWAAQRSGMWAWTLTFLFIWMKVWQSVFAFRLRSRLASSKPKPRRFRDIFRVVFNQTILHTTGLIILPVAFSLLFPFGYAYAFYQNVSVLDDGTQSLRHLMRRAHEQARLWQRQNIFVIWLVSPFFLITTGVFCLFMVPLLNPILSELGEDFFELLVVVLLFLCVPCSPVVTILAINVAISLFLIPWLAETLLGINLHLSLITDFWMSSVFAATVCGLVYLLVDPLVKAVYVLRCFYGESLYTGEDLRVRLRNLSKASKTALALALLACSFCLTSGAGTIEQESEAVLQGTDMTSGISPTELNVALDEIFRRQEFAWRFPSSSEEVSSDDTTGLVRWLLTLRETITSWVNNVFQKVLDFLDYLRRIFDRMFPTGSERQDATGGGRWVRQTILVLALLCVIAGILILIKTRHPFSKRAATTPVQTTTVPDLTDEGLQPDKLPEEEWIRMAQQLSERGDYRLALRALFLALLVRFARGGIITLAKYKTNREYLNEVARRCREKSVMKTTFGECVRVFEQVWYGGYPATESLVSEFHLWVNQASRYETS